MASCIKAVALASLRNTAPAVCICRPLWCQSRQLHIEWGKEKLWGPPVLPEWLKYKRKRGEPISEVDLHESNPKDSKSLNPQLVRKVSPQLRPVLIFLSHKTVETTLTHICECHTQITGSCFPPNIFTKITRQLGKEQKDTLVMEGS